MKRYNQGISYESVRSFVIIRVLYTITHFFSYLVIVIRRIMFSQLLAIHASFVNWNGIQKRWIKSSLLFSMC